MNYLSNLERTIRWDAIQSKRLSTQDDINTVALIIADIASTRIWARDEVNHSGAHLDLLKVCEDNLERAVKIFQEKAGGRR